MSQQAITPPAINGELSIYTVAELRAQCLAWLSALDAQPDDEAAPLPLAGVDLVDGAGLQLLLSLDRAFQARGQALRLAEPSGAVRSGCAALGLDDWLQARCAVAAEEQTA